LAHRLGVYYRNTAPLLDYYRAQGKLHTVDGMAPVEAVTAEIAVVLDGVPACLGYATINPSQELTGGGHFL
jgi:adenylate kinase